MRASNLPPRVASRDHEAGSCSTPRQVSALDSHHHLLLQASDYGHPVRAALPFWRQVRAHLFLSVVHRVVVDIRI